MLTTAFLIGLVGSLHCVGMCGPLALSLPVTSSSKWLQLLGVLLYNSGRIVTYMLLGAVIGMVGQSFSMVGMQQTVSIASGVFLLAMVLLPLIHHKFHLNWFQNSSFNQFVKKKIGQFFMNKQLIAFPAIGFFNGLLPCGLVYVAIAGALVQTNIYQSMTYMMLFGLGTVPLMMLVVYSKTFIPSGVRLKLNKAIPVFILFLGFLFIIRGLNLGIPYLSPQIGGFTFNDPAPVCH